ncbi:MAG: GntR family transcriptional regulator [Desulfitobacteriaceae bacterium]|nr:GntR family transcriptional regulator [Desulfitobacteriaceae bacterium]MDD4752583.1 GntR family transcriptional regulator [Desulfitobacteriaceae bacterium]
MEFDARVPIYLQIIDKIQRDIILGRLKEGEKLPSVRLMALDLKVNVNTVQRVYQELEREGVIITQRGIGSFITEDEEIIKKIRQQMADELLKNFLEGMKGLGMSFADIVKCLKDYISEEEKKDAANKRPD